MKYENGTLVIQVSSAVGLTDLCQCLTTASVLSTIVPSRSSRIPAYEWLSIGAVNAGSLASEDMMSYFSEPDTIKSC